MDDKALNQHWSSQRTKDTHYREVRLVIIRRPPNGQRFHVVAPFSREFVNWAREHGGTWRQRTALWTFPQTRKEEVIAQLAALFGFENILRHDR